MSALSSEPRRISVHSTTWMKVAHQMPTKRIFDADEPLGSDIFVCARGFEERIIRVPSELSTAGIHRFAKILVGQYITNEAENAFRYRELEPLLRRLTDAPIAVFPADSPVMTFRTIQAEIDASAAPNPTVVFDISGASSTLIFSTIAAVARHPRRPTLKILYTTAQHYFPDQDELNAVPASLASASNLRELGIRGVDISELYAGHHEQPEGRGLLHIVFVGLAFERLQRCLGYLGEELTGTDSSSVHWVLPRDDGQTSPKRLEMMKAALSTWVPPDGPRAQHRSECAPLDYLEAAAHLIHLVDIHAGHNVSLVHMASKLQSVGLALALEVRREAALVFARPQEFSAHRYSQGTGKTWVLELEPYANVQLLSTVGDLELQTERHPTQSDGG